MNNFRALLGVAVLFAVAAPSARADTILVGAPNASGSYHGMLGINLVAEFTLSGSKHVTTIDVVLASSGIYDFSCSHNRAHPRF